MIRYFLKLSLPLFVLDQITKYLIVANFPDPREGGRRIIEVIDGFFNIVRVHNTGMAWGMLNGNPYSNYIFGTIAVAALVFISVLWKKGAFPTKITKVAAALLVSGIIGNLTDRLLPGRGYVVDFLDFLPPFYSKIDPNSGGHFPSFNVADSCITVAAVLLIFSSICDLRNERKQRQQAQEK